MSIPWKFEMSSPFNANDQIYRPLLLADWPAPFHGSNLPKYGSDLPKTWVIWIEIYTFGLYLFVKCQPRCSKKKRLKCLIIQKHNTKTDTLLKLLKENRTNVLPDWRIFYQPKGMTRGLPNDMPSKHRSPQGGMTGRLGLYPHGWWENHFHVKCSNFLG